MVLQITSVPSMRHRTRLRGRPLHRLESEWHDCGTLVRNSQVMADSRFRLLMRVRIPHIAVIRQENSGFGRAGDLGGKDW